jgi:ABC-type dipeptide/oligopeptide/nickel transport system permease subunit
MSSLHAGSSNRKGKRELHAGKESPPGETFLKPEGDRKTLQNMWRVLKRDMNALIGVIIILIVLMTALSAPWLAPYHYSDQHIIKALKGPCAEFWLGTDEYGRDILSRIIWGARPALLVGLLSMILSMSIGIPVGLLAGYKMGKVDAVVSWFVDVMLSFPSLLLGLLMVTLLGPGMDRLIVAIGMAYLPQFIRLARGPTIAVRNLEFVTASRTLGAGGWRMVFVHIFPNIIGPIIIMGTLNIAAAIRMEAGLSFLGLGIQPPFPSWGNMIREGVRNILDTPWIAVFPGFVLTINVFAFNMVGDSLRDIFDPRELMKSARKFERK